MPWCFSCASHLRRGIIKCPNCGSLHIVEEPEVFVRNDAPPPMEQESINPGWPLSGKRMPVCTMLFLSGTAGTGKTTFLSMMGPDVINTNEQSPDKVAVRLKQTNPSHKPCLIRFSRDKPTLPPGDAVVGLDSSTNLVNGENWVVEEFFNWVQCKGQYKSSAGARRWGIVISQATKEGDYAGSATVPHICDFCVHLWGDPWTGYRVADIWKYRFGGIERRYYDLAEQVERVQFRGVFGIMPKSPGFRFIPKSARRQGRGWYPKIDASEYECEAIAAIPRDRFPGWGFRRNERPSNAEIFAHTHNVCYFDNGRGEIIHCPRCRHSSGEKVKYPEQPELQLELEAEFRTKSKGERA